MFKFADDTKLFRQDSDTVDALGMQEDLDRLVEWADKWQMQFNVSKCKVMHVGKKNPRQDIIEVFEMYRGYSSVALQELFEIYSVSQKKGATLYMAITLSILDRFAKFFHCCKEQ